MKGQRKWKGPVQLLITTDNLVVPVKWAITPIRVRLEGVWIARESI